MKHYLRNIILIGGVVFQTALCGVTAEDFILHEGEVKTIEVDQNHTFSKAGRIGGAINAKKFSLEKNSKLNIQGEIFEEVKNPILKSVILTSVSTTNDLSFSKVYFTCMNEDKDVVMKELEEAKGFLRGKLSENIPCPGTCSNGRPFFGHLLDRHWYDYHGIEVSCGFYRQRWQRLLFGGGAAKRI